MVAAFAACSRADRSPQGEQPAGGATSASAASVPDSPPLPRVDGARALEFTRAMVEMGPRILGSPGHAKAEAYLRSQLKGDGLEEDAFTATTPAGPFPMRNYIAKFPGSKPGIIVLAGHYDTLYGRNDFVGANDGASSTGLLLELARQLRGQKRDGYSIWLVWLDGEEAVRQWTSNDSLYGSRHLAAKWAKDGTLRRVKAFLLADMVGDADLNIEHDASSTPWLEDVVYQAAGQLGYQAHFFARTLDMDDDHIPFAREGVPVADLIDFNYGRDNAYWHTSQDTMDKLSAKSLEMVGSVMLQTARLLDQH